MEKSTIPQQTFNKLDPDTYLLSWIEAFLIDRRAQGLTAGSVRYYQQKLKTFSDYCESQALTRIDQITPAFLRQFLIYLEETGHNPGGIHGYYRSIKAFLRWYEAEVEPENWKNPIDKVKAPKVPDEPIDPVEIADVEKMAACCRRKTFNGDRDYALLLFLLDTGTRVKECLDLNWEDIDLITGAVSIRQGKGRKPRTVFLEKKARRALRAYAKHRNDTNPAVWVTDEKERLQEGGLRDILKRRAIDAGVPIPSGHDFRRAFALNMLRNGCDLITLARLMGHTSLAVLKRYLKQVNADLQAAHQKSSPVEHAKNL